MRSSKWFALAVVALTIAMIGTPAIGQEKPYPTKSITYLVTFDPGGQSDREARRQQPLLEKILSFFLVVLRTLSMDLVTESVNIVRSISISPALRQLLVSRRERGTFCLIFFTRIFELRFMYTSKRRYPL